MQMKYLFLTLCLIGSLVFFSEHASSWANNPNLRGSPCVTFPYTENTQYTKTAFVVSDQAARKLVDLFSSAADKIGDATQGNRAEERESSNDEDGVEIEHVDDLDVRSPRLSKTRRNDDQDR